MGRLRIMMFEIAGLLIISFILRLLLSIYGVEEGTFSRWFPVIAALLIVYTVRFRMRKKISAKKLTLSIFLAVDNSRYFMSLESSVLNLYESKTSKNQTLKSIISISI